MPPAFRTVPETSVAVRRQIIFNASKLTSAVLLAISTLISIPALVSAMNYGQQSFRFSDLIILPIALVLMFIAWVPVLLGLWPVASLALRLGVAGWATAPFALAAASAFIAVGAAGPNLLSLTGGATCGAALGALYWYGAFRSYPNAFTRPPQIGGALGGSGWQRED